MKLYHMSDTLPLNTVMTADYKETTELVMPFLQALERSEDCFFAMLMAAKHQKAVLKKFGLQDMWTNYVKWATEAIFEYVRRNEYPNMPCRITGHYFFDNLESVLELYRVDWAGASEEERAKIRLYEVDLEDECPARLDMRLFDDAFDAMWDQEDVQTTLRCARSYFSGQPGENPVWELLSEAKAIAVADISKQLSERE